MGFTFTFGLVVLLLWNQSVHPWWISNMQFCNVIWLKGTSILDRGVVWMWCTIQVIFMLCVVSVVTTMVIGINIRSHNKFVHNIKILSYVYLNQFQGFKLCYKDRKWVPIDVRTSSLVLVFLGNHLLSWVLFTCARGFFLRGWGLGPMLSV